MLFSRTETMQPLLESANGVHLTAYIANDGNVNSLKEKLNDALDQACEYLAPAMGARDIENFFKPIELLIKDTKKLSSFVGNIGIFRTQTSFRVLSLPIEVESACIVADSFHVKPLLKWIQSDRDFLFLGIEAGSATLFQGSLHTFKEIDTIIFPDLLRGNTKEEFSHDSAQKMIKQQKLHETMEWLNAWIMNLTVEVRPRLFVAGNKEVTAMVLKVLQYENTYTHPIWPSFASKKALDICTEIRSILRAEVRKEFEKAIVEFHYATDVNLAKGNVFTIAKAAVQGKIKKLLISDGIKIFGKLNRKSGDLAIHEVDQDHEDDDILDDLAQTVWANGGEVVVAPLGVIPKGRPILAIFDESPNLEMTKPKAFVDALKNYPERNAI